MKRHDDNIHELVELIASSARIVCTSSHRIVCESGPVVADRLKVGDHVQVGTDGFVELTCLSKRTQAVSVFEIIFDPDEPVETRIRPPQQILTMGQDSTLRYELAVGVAPSNRIPSQLP